MEFLKLSHKHLCTVLFEIRIHFLSQNAKYFHREINMTSQAFIHKGYAVLTPGTDT